MKELKDILTEEELELATKMAKEFAEKVLLDFSNQKEALATEIQKLTEEDEVLSKQRTEISDWKSRESINEKRKENYKIIQGKKNQLKTLENQLKAITNGGTIIEFEDKVGKIYKGVADFRNVKTEVIGFDQDTILVEPVPAYIPFIDEEEFKLRGGVLDAIRLTTDTYVVAYSRYKFNSENEAQVFLLTLDQLVLTSLYYITKIKAIYQKEADRKTQRAKDSYFSLPLERRERYYNQKNFYFSLNNTLRKKYTEEEWNGLPLEKKEELAPAYSATRPKKFESTLAVNKMYGSFHDMYNVFINPELLGKSSDKTTSIPIGKSVIGGYANSIVFKYWESFREMMEYKFKDIEFQIAEMSENYKTAIETSFGESNTENYLYADYGVLVKRQNGDKINASETEQIEQGLIEISKVFGNLKDEFIQNNMKISHTGKKLVFAQKAVGVYIPSMGTIAVSDKYGEIQFNSTFAHELAHFIDNKLGQKNGKRWETDNFESTAGVIAFTFRNNLNKPKEQQTDYINATKECFARAMQQYFVMQKYGDDVEIVYGYGNFSVPEKIANQEVFVNKENFNSKIKPLIEQFLQENKDFFSAELQMKKVVEEIKETTAEIVPAIENKKYVIESKGFREGIGSSSYKQKREKQKDDIKNQIEKIELQEAIETLKILLETLPDDEKQEVEEALEVLEMLDGNSFAKGGLIAPNGNESNLTAEQYKLVRTPEFKKWFGDWENEPKYASKVVDENGEPLVVYHGTKNYNRFYKFRKGSKGYLGGGIYFTSDKQKAKGYSQYGIDYVNLYEVFLDIKDPFEVTGSIGTDDFLNKLYGSQSIYKKRSDKQSFDTMIIKSSDIKKLLEKGYDGIYWNTADEFVVYNSNQIKLADGTNTTFNFKNDDIRYDNGGIIEFKEKQLEIINKTNPAPNNYNTWVRSVDDIKTAKEAFSVAFEDGAMYPDFEIEQMNETLESGFVIIYSSYPIKEGTFVTPSKMNAEEYAGGRDNKIYSKKVSINDIAWIDESEGQYAPINY
jgi:hypothetical protein